jgi:four helix bundle protein
MHDFRRLQVWQRSGDLVVAVEQVVRRFPRSDRGVVSSQLRRAAISISSNITEGCGKSSRRETIRYLQIAAGSATETENHVLIAAKLGYMATAVADELVSQSLIIQRMLHKLMKNLPE